MTQVQQALNYQGAMVETVRKDGELWFVAKDICDVLGLQNVALALTSLDEEDKLLYPLHRSGQKRDLSLVNESGLYSLIFASRKEEARVFKRWITREVLPQIRKTGMYMPDESDWYQLAKQEYSYAVHNLDGWWRGRYIRKADFDYAKRGFENGLPIQTACCMFGLSADAATQLQADVIRLQKAAARLGIFTERAAV